MVLKHHHLWNDCHLCAVFEKDRVRDLICWQFGKFTYEFESWIIEVKLCIPYFMLAITFIEKIKFLF